MVLNQKLFSELIFVFSTRLSFIAVSNQWSADARSHARESGIICCGWKLFIQEKEAKISYVSLFTGAHFEISTRFYTSERC